MNNRNVSIMMAGFVLCGALAARADLPKGWIAAGSQPKEYEMSVDRAVVHGGAASATLKSIVSKASGFGTLMQTCKADEYRGKRVRMSGYVRTQDVADWAGLWLRVDGPEGKVQAFDNMHDRAIKGTADWQYCEIVLDVPRTAQQLAFGVLLSGTGQVWMDDLKFEVVTKEVPSTGSSGVSAASSAPQNLTFEE